MLELNDLTPLYWEDETKYREYEKKDGSKITLLESKELIECYINKVSIIKDEEFEDEETVFITVDNDDYSAFTILINLVQRVFPKIYLQDFRELDEIMECYYAGDNAKSIITDLVREIQMNSSK